MSGQSGKKSKKKAKSKTIPLNDFLQDGQATGMVKQIKCWADEADSEYHSINSSLTYQSTSAPKVIQLPTAPRAARSIEVDHTRIPENGPYTAFVGNLPYEVDEFVLQEFFKGLPITNVRLPNENGRFKGFGYVQFADKQSLIKALEMNEETLQKRNIRIDVADNQNKDGGSSYGRSGDRHGSQGGPDPTETNWRTAAAAEESSRNSQYHDRRDSHRNDGYDGGNQYRRGSQGYDRYDRGYDRGYNDRSGYNRGYDRSRYDDRGGYDRPRYNDRGYDRQRSDEGYGGSRRDQEPPRERPQLNLKPRQKPLDSDATATTRSSSIFGSAKPVDTASKEREIEEKLISRQKSTEEPKGPEKRSANIFGGARPIDTSKRDREIEEKISAQKERLVSSTTHNQAPPPRSSVFGDAKPVDTAARERQIEEKMRKQEEQHHHSSSSYRHERDGSSRSHSRIPSERSDDGGSSPRRQSRTSSRSTDEYHESSGVQKPSEAESRKPEYKPAPPPKENAWGRKPTASDHREPIPSKRDVPAEKVLKAPPPSTNAWNRGPPKADRGEREEAEGNSKEDEEEERTPEGAADEESTIQTRNEPGDGSEGGVQDGSYASSSRQASQYKSNKSQDSHQDRPGPGRYGGGRNYSSDYRGHNEGPNYRGDNRRRGDGDSYSSRNEHGRGYERNQRDRRDAGARTRTKNEWPEKKRDSSRDSRPECDRPDAAGQEQSNTKPTKSRSKLQQAEKEKPPEIVTLSKFALLAVDDSDDEVAMD